MKEREQISPARQLVQVIWDNANKDSNRGHSWTYLNQSLHQAVCLAIFSGLKFGADDFIYFAQKLRSHYWAHQNNAANTGEGWYCRAVEHNNLSACHAFERWKNRKPFIWEGVRVHIGHHLVIDKEQWRVTSFAGDGSHFIAVMDRPERKLKRFTSADLKAMRADRKKASQSAEATPSTSI